MYGKKTRHCVAEYRVVHGLPSESGVLSVDIPPGAKSVSTLGAVTVSHKICGT